MILLIRNICYTRSAVAAKNISHLVVSRSLVLEALGLLR